MRISTNQIFDKPKALMSSLNEQATALQTEISTNQRIQTASDDTAGWVQLQGLSRADADGNAYASNVKLAQGLLGQADGALQSVQDQLQRAQELATQAATGTLNPSDRASISAELGGVMDELLSLANSTDTRGQPVFGGADGATPYAKAADGTISYTGTGQPSAIPTGANSSVVPGVTGDRAFGTVFATLKAMKDALDAGTTPPASTLDDLQSASSQVDAARASVGARETRLTLQSQQLTDAATAREESRTKIDAPDIAATVTELQKTLTVLQATQASFTKLTSMSLFDFLK